MSSALISHKIPFTKSSISIIILAAGVSKRLGEPKQLLKFKDKPLILHSLEQAFFAKCQAVFTVLGANSEKIIPLIKHLPVEIIVNKNWKQGMGGSVSCGVKAVKEKSPNSEGVILMVSDQPYVSSDLLHQILLIQKSNDFEIVSSEYQKGFGVPVFFSKKYFSELENLNGEKGAKKIILNNLHQTGFISFPEGNFDIDTIADYRKLLEIEAQINSKI